MIVMELLKARSDGAQSSARHTDCWPLSPQEATGHKPAGPSVRDEPMTGDGGFSRGHSTEEHQGHPEDEADSYVKTGRKVW